MIELGEDVWLREQERLAYARFRLTELVALYKEFVAGEEPEGGPLTVLILSFEGELSKEGLIA